MPSQVYEFPAGIYGFPDAHSFVLLPIEREGFFWLQSVEFEALTFLLMDPFLFVDGYTVDLSDAQLTELLAEDPSSVLVLSIVTLPRDTDSQPTANLQGPVAFNVVERRGKQVAIESGFGVRHPIDFQGPAKK